ncbi:MAG: beta-lactamase family protein [Ruminococcus sp.]|nr:beta-lactamase family protein [Ruminococcus sp.]
MKNAIDRFISDSISDKSTVGASCLVFKDGQEVYSGVFGKADRENDIPMRRDSICRLFSLTKPVTAAAAMILFDRGLLSPETPVSDIFPEYGSLTYLDSSGNILPCGKTMTVFHLLTMTSGVPYPNNFNASVKAAGALFDRIFDGNDGLAPKVSTEEFARCAARIPLLFPCGEHWDYGLSADILGAVIEKVSGMRYGEFLRENIFAPLGMDDTGFFVPKEKQDRFTALYKWEDGKLVRDSQNYLALSDYLSQPSFESGGAGLVSTIDDYSKFARMLTGGGELDGVRIISPESFAYMTSPLLGKTQQADLWDRLSGYNYGCLVRVKTDESIAQVKTAEGEFGWDGWTGTYFNSNKNTGITVLYFTQIAGAGTTWQAEAISKLAYEQLS